MKFTAKVDIKLNVTQVVAMVEDASRKGLRDVTVRIHAQTVAPPPLGSPRKTGNNARSIGAEASGFPGLVADGGEATVERVVDESKIESAVYSTSGYGGILEVGSNWSTAPGARYVNARPYFGPARDRFFTESNLGNAIKRHIR